MIYGEAYTPKEIAEKVLQVGVGKARSPWPTLLTLSVLAGAYISLGGLFYSVIISGETLSGSLRFVGGIGFCLGLILVVIGGAELFTGNNLLAMAWASRLISVREVLRNWMIVYFGNVIGCLGTVFLVLLAQSDTLLNGDVGANIVHIAQSKSQQLWFVAIARGVLCNALVCLAVWLAMGGRSVTDKILAIILPISGFVTMGFEHVIANWFFFPYAWFLDASHTLNGTAVLLHFGYVTLGNILGGTLLVSVVYWVAYLRQRSQERT